MAQDDGCGSDPSGGGESATRSRGRLFLCHFGPLCGHTPFGVSVDLAAIRAAHERIRPYIKRTPVLTSEALDAARGARLHFKCENLQTVGAFKARGACNA